MKTNTLSLLLIPMLACFSLSPTAQAVSPAPDGCYPGFTTAEGCNALQSLTGGAGNTGVGWGSLKSVTTGSYNTGVGAGTLLVNTGTSNTAVGAAALLLNTTGRQNTAVGTDALVHNDGGGSNTAVGYEALFSNTTFGGNTGAYNSAIGDSALFSNTTGNANVAFGYGALSSNETGGFNTAIGVAALAVSTGNNDTAIGQGALFNSTTGNGNIAVGVFAGQGVINANNVICVGAPGNNVDNSCYIGNIFGATSSNGVGVFVNSNGRLGTMTSSRRFKEDIKPLDKASEAVLLLRPVSFRYKREVDPEGTSAVQFGLVAEDVEKITPDLIVRDKEGKPYSVRYEAVNAMLLNEFLKEHRKVEKLEATVASLAATVKEQAALIQKVSAEVELNKPAPQTVLNSQ